MAEVRKEGVLQLESKAAECDKESLERRRRWYGGYLRGKDAQLYEDTRCNYIAL